MAFTLFGALVVAAIAGIAIGMIYYKTKRFAIIVGVATIIGTLGMAMLVPIIVTVSTVLVVFVFLSLSLKFKGLKGSEEREVTILILTVVMVLILVFGNFHVWQNQPYTTTREVTQSLDLIAVKENTRFSGHFFFLSGSMEQSDYYDYRYIDGIGSRLGRISKFAPLIVEDANLTDKGTLRRYQTYRTVDEQHGIIKFLYGDLPKKSAVGQEEVEIYVPVGSVDRTMSSL